MPRHQVLDKQVSYRLLHCNIENIKNLLYDIILFENDVFGALSDDNNWELNKNDYF